MNLNLVVFVQWHDIHFGGCDFCRLDWLQGLKNASKVLFFHRIDLIEGDLEFKFSTQLETP